MHINSRANYESVPQVNNKCTHDTCKAQWISYLQRKKKKQGKFFHLNSTFAEMQNKSTVGRIASFSHSSLSHPSSPLLSSPPSSHPSIHLCSLALCGESAVTVCPSSCGPSCLGQMGSSPPHPPSSMMSMRGPLNLKPRNTGPEA